MPIFMQAGSIKGDVVAAKYEGWVQVTSCSFDIAFAEDDVRKSRTEGAPQPELDLFVVTKTTTDRSGPEFMQWMVNGDRLAKVELHVCGDTVGMGEWRCHLKYVLEGVVLKEYSLDMSDAEKGEPTVHLKLQYDALSVEHTSYDRANMRRSTSKTIRLQRIE